MPLLLYQSNVKLEFRVLFTRKQDSGTAGLYTSFRLLNTAVCLDAEQERAQFFSQGAIQIQFSLRVETFLVNCKLSCCVNHPCEARHNGLIRNMNPASPCKEDDFQTSLPSLVEFSAICTSWLPRRERQSAVPLPASLDASISCLPETG